MDYVSRPTLEFTDRTLQQLQEGQTLVHPDDIDVQKAAHATRRSGQICDYEFRFKRGDGEYRWFQSRGRPLRDDSGKIVRWWGLQWDINERKIAEAALKESEETLREREKHFRSLSETIGALVWSSSPTGALEYANHRVVEYTGKSVEELNRKGWADLVHPDDLDNVVRAWNKSVKDGGTFQEVCRLRGGNGLHRWFQVRAEPLLNEAGELVRWYGLDIDIDDTKRMAEELRFAQARLSRAAHVASVAELSASIAHEVNQPLAAVVANAQACLRWLSLADPNIERAQIAAKDIISDGNDAAEVIRRIRALFEKQAPSKVILSVNATITEVLRLLHEEVVRNDISVATDLAPNLRSVAADQIQLQQVILNLVQNAVEAMGTTQAPRNIRIQTRQAENACVMVSITDNGPGLADGDRVFDAFFTTKSKGMGMGLSICRSIVEAHGGRIWAEPAQPRGARFTFELPLQFD